MKRRLYNIFCTTNIGNFIDPISESSYKVLSKEQNSNPTTTCVMLTSLPKFITLWKVPFLELEILSKFCLQLHMEKLIWRILFKVSVTEEKNINHFNVKLSGVSEPIKGRGFLLIFILHESTFKMLKLTNEVKETVLLLRYHSPYGVDIVKLS